MYIGEVSKRTGLSVKAIRFYEVKGLIHKPQRVGRYRVYQETDIDILLLIKEAKELGVTLSQLKGVFVYTDGELDWLQVKLFLGDIKFQLQSKILELQGKINKIDECCDKMNIKNKA